MLIWAGLGADNPVTRALAARPLVLIGDWSYSLYLWHWPLVVVSKALWPFSPVAPVAATLVSVGFAWASWRFIETPLRTMELPSARVIGTRLAQVIGIPVLVLALCFGGLTWMKASMAGGALASRFGDQPWGPASTVAFETCPWAELIDIGRGAGVCLIRDASRPPDVVILGDSHSEDVHAAFAESLPGANIAIVSARVPHMYYGPEGLQKVIDRLVTIPQLKTVILSRMLDRTPQGLFDHERVSIGTLAEQLSRAGKQFFVLEDRPIFETDIFRCAYRTALVIPQPDCEAPRARFVARHTLVAAGVDAALKDINGAYRVETYFAFCNEQTCARADGENVLYSDGDHLGPAGARRYVKFALESSPELAASVAAWR